MALVLVVDDDPGMRQLVRRNLELDGHDVRVAADGEEALQRVEERRPDLLLLDVTMPRVDGWQVLERIKAHTDPDIASIPVLLLTADATPEARARGGIEGAIGHLVKPFNPAALRHEVLGALDGEPEIDKRRRVQRATLEELAREQRGGDPPERTEIRPRLTRLERRPVTSASEPDAGLAAVRAKVPALTDNQRQLLAALGDAPSVTEAAAGLGVSRSNVYASLRRVSRRLGVGSVTDLLGLVRSGALHVDVPA